MNTKTMRLPPRRVLTPSGSTNKRKEREDSFERPKPITTSTTSKLLKPDRPSPRHVPEPITTTPTSSSSKGFELTPSNQLLAGYLAHEYLTKGTLLGHPWAPARAESPTVAEKKKEKSGEDCGGEEGGAAAATPCRKVEEERERYVKVAELLRGGGVHLSGVVNPTQLARFIHL